MLTLTEQHPQSTSEITRQPLDAISLQTARSVMKNIALYRHCLVATPDEATNSDVISSVIAFAHEGLQLPTHLVDPKAIGNSPRRMRKAAGRLLAFSEEHGSQALVLVDHSDIYLQRGDRILNAERNNVLRYMLDCLQEPEDRPALCVTTVSEPVPVYAEVATPEDFRDFYDNFRDAARLSAAQLNLDQRYAANMARFTGAIDQQMPWLHNSSGTDFAVAA